MMANNCNEKKNMFGAAPARRRRRGAQRGCRHPQARPARHGGGIERGRGGLRRLSVCGRRRARRAGTTNPGGNPSLGFAAEHGIAA